MNKLHLGLALIIGAVVVALGLSAFGVFSLALSQKTAQPVNLGSASGYQAMNNQNLLTELNAINAPLSNIGSGVTAAIDFPSVNSASSSATSTQVTGLVAAIGDQVLVQPNFASPETSTVFSGVVLTASTTSATIGIIESNGTGAAYDATSTTFNVIVLPTATFKASAG